MNPYFISAFSRTLFLFNNIFRLSFVEVNLNRIQNAIDTGALDANNEINAVSLMEAGVVRRSKDGIRILGNGELKTKVTIRAVGATASAKAAIEKVGGELIIDTTRPGSEKSEEVAEVKTEKKVAKKATKKETK